VVKMRKDVKTRVTPRRERRYKAKLWCGRAATSKADIIGSPLEFWRTTGNSR
jgi:hypothetical protein